MRLSFRNYNLTGVGIGIYKISLTALTICANIELMSETTKTTANKKPNYKLRRTVAAAAAGVIATGAFAAVRSAEHGPDPAFMQGKEYVVKPGDTPWTIVSKAYPNSDPREATYNIDQSLPEDEAHADGTLQPGDKVVMSGKSELGEPVMVSSAVKEHLPAVVPVSSGDSTESSDGIISETKIQGETTILPNSPPSSPEG
jgi:hypothetical protein